MEKPVLSMSTKLAFGLGASGEAASNWIFNALTFFFYNQIIGLSGTLTAAAVTIGIASDAITDPVVGSISDRWRSKLASKSGGNGAFRLVHGMDGNYAGVFNLFCRAAFGHGG